MIARSLAAIALTLLPSFGFAQSAERSVTLEVNATVRSVDADTRVIVLENEANGQSESIVAGPEVVNFDQIEVGDKVTALYTLGIAARMAIPNEVGGEVEIDVQAMSDDKPGTLTSTAVTLVLEFISFDAVASIATVKDSSGAEQMIEVKTDVGREFAKELNSGEMVALTYHEGLMIGIVEE